MTTPDTETSRADRKAAEAYLKRVPFTISGFGRQEVELILFAYRNAFLAGIQHGREAERERIAREVEDRRYDLPGREAEWSRFIARAIRAGGEPEGKE